MKYSYEVDALKTLGEITKHLTNGVHPAHLRQAKHAARSFLPDRPEYVTQCFSLPDEIGQVQHALWSPDGQTLAIVAQAGQSEALLIWRKETGLLERCRGVKIHSVHWPKQHNGNQDDLAYLVEHESKIEVRWDSKLHVNHLSPGHLGIYTDEEPRLLCWEDTQGERHYALNILQEKSDGSIIPTVITDHMRFDSEPSNPTIYGSSGEHAYAIDVTKAGLVILLKDISYKDQHLIQIGDTKYSLPQGSYVRGPRIWYHHRTPMISHAMNRGVYVTELNGESIIEEKTNDIQDNDARWILAESGRPYRVQQSNDGDILLTPYESTQEYRIPRTRVNMASPSTRSFRIWESDSLVVVVGPDAELSDRKRHFVMFRRDGEMKYHSWLNTACEIKVFDTCVVTAIDRYRDAFFIHSLDQIDQYVPRYGLELSLLQNQVSSDGTKRLQSFQTSRDGHLAYLLNYEYK